MALSDGAVSPSSWFLRAKLLSSESVETPMAYLQTLLTLISVALVDSRHPEVRRQGVELVFPDLSIDAGQHLAGRPNSDGRRRRAIPGAGRGAVEPGRVGEALGGLKNPGRHPKAPSQIQTAFASRMKFAKSEAGMGLAM